MNQGTSLQQVAPDEPVPAEPGSGNKEVEPDYDDLPRGDPNPMWEVAIGMVVLLAVLGALVAFSS